MTDLSKSIPQKGARHHDERAKRLAAALRENLKRRKAQARLKGRDHKPAGTGRDK